MNKLIPIFLAAFPASVNVDIDIEKPTLFLCSETTNSNYQYIIFMIRGDGWLYDVINTREARLNAYGNSAYTFQTLSRGFMNNSYYSESWVHNANSKYTLLTTSNSSREFMIDTTRHIFQEIESGVKTENLAGHCSVRNFNYLLSFTAKLESESHSWSQSEVR